MPIHDWKKVNAGAFHHFHHQWTARLCDALNAGALPAGYYALAEQVASGPIPDVLTLQRWPRPAEQSGGTGGIAVTTDPPQTMFVRKAEPEVYAARANRIVIRDSLDRVVAVIEIVSPGNKESRHGIRSFVEKAVDFLNQGVHLLIVDLFPPTPRDPQGIHKAIWDEIRDEPFELPSGKPLTLAAYDAGPIKTAYVEPVAVGSVMRAMPIFLEPEVYVPAPLEATYQATWNASPDALKERLETQRPENGLV